jgi:phage-related protein
MTYNAAVSRDDKPLVWLHGQAKSPPFSGGARLEAGFLLRKLQKGEALEMPGIGARCHELRVVDADKTWRFIYRFDEDAIVIVEVFSKKSRATPRSVIDQAKKRLRDYDHA